MTSKHPCFHYNRPPFPDTVTVQDGWEEMTVMLADDEPRRIRVPRMVTRPNPMSKECQQWGEYGWARIQVWDCSGCRWMHNTAPQPPGEPGTTGDWTDERSY